MTAALTDRQRQELALRLASPKRPGARDPKPVDGLALFDQARQPNLF